MSTLKSNCAVKKGQDGQTSSTAKGSGCGEPATVERVPIAAVTWDQDEGSVRSLHATAKEAEGRLRSAGPIGNGGVLHTEGIFDGTRFAVAFGRAVDWEPMSLVDVPPRHKLSTDDFCDEGARRFEQFDTREEAFRYVAECNATAYRNYGRASDWAVVCEIGQRMEVSTTTSLEIRGDIGTFEHHVVYPVRIAKATPEEIERHKIHAASEEPAVV